MDRMEVNDNDLRTAFDNECEVLPFGDILLDIPIDIVNCNLDVIIREDPLLCEALVPNNETEDPFLLNISSDFISFGGTVEVQTISIDSDINQMIPNGSQSHSNANQSNIN